MNTLNLNILLILNLVIYSYSLYNRINIFNKYFKLSLHNDIFNFDNNKKSWGYGTKGKQDNIESNYEMRKYREIGKGFGFSERVYTQQKLIRRIKPVHDENNKNDEKFGDLTEKFIKKNKGNYVNQFEPNYLNQNNLTISEEFKRLFLTNEEEEEEFKRIFINNNIKKLNIKYNNKQNLKNAKSKNFEIINNYDLTFQNVAGFDLTKQELLQCADILVNYTKYAKYDVRTPKGLILEGPPGNGKTFIAKAFSGEIGVGFIPVSGSQFQEKYVGVGASRIRELFKLAADNKPCIVFIDEIDALGRKRSSNADTENTERDSTLNELLVCLDGFKDNKGIFLIGATNRMDLLDPALLRPGRIDKKIFIGKPDKNTRRELIKINLKNKPYSKEIKIDELLQMTNGLSCAEIENFFNEVMLMVLRENRELITLNDLKTMHNRILTGWQNTENKLSDETIKQVAIHEVGHALIAILLNYKKVSKISINLWSPTSLGFTLFEENEEDQKSLTKNKLKNEIMVLLGGRIAEEIFYDNKISSGAFDDINRVKKIINTMIIDYGMGNNILFPINSEKNKEIIDNEIYSLYHECYEKTKELLINSIELIDYISNILIEEKEISGEFLYDLINNKF